MPGSMIIAGTAMKKIAIVLLLGMLSASDIAAQAQQTPRLPRVARLSPSSAPADEIMLAGFRRGLKEHGWIENKNIALEYRFADGKTDRLNDLAAELVRLKVDIILSGATVGAQAAKRATSTIPIVLVTTGDPVAAGLVASLARPGGNLTGVTALGQELSGKRLQLLKEALPGINQVAVLSNPTNPDSKFSVKEVEVAAHDLGVKLKVHEAGDPTKLEGSFRTMSAERAGAVLVLTDSMFLTHRKRIVELAAHHRLPAMYPISEYANAGGLMFYGANFPEMYRHAAVFVDKILKGSKPADLPVEQAKKFELVINLKTAKQIGLTIPPNVLARADRVIR
ncbi:MAG TPA: ABC transporter substrate-binding protein [Candidatus Binatia bacterium]|nr:ABC transporter substrate-binding protein [Candidatus Binatia bacterium]